MPPPERRFVSLTPELALQVERLRVAYPAISEAQLRTEAFRRGVVEMLGTVPRPVPTLMPVQLRRVG